MLATIAGLLTYAGLWPFTFMVAAGSAILAWEWGRLVRQATLDAGFIIHAATTIATCFVAATGSGWTAFLVLVAGACAAALATHKLHTRAWSAFGVLYLGLPGLLLVLFRADQDYGIAAIFFKAMVMASLALLISTFSSSTLFTIVIAVVIYFIGHFTADARNYWLYSQKAGVSKELKMLTQGVALIFPKNKLY